MERAHGQNSIQITRRLSLRLGMCLVALCRCSDSVCVKIRVVGVVRCICLFMSVQSPNHAVTPSVLKSTSNSKDCFEGTLTAKIAFKSSALAASCLLFAWVPATSAARLAYSSACLSVKEARFSDAATMAMCTSSGRGSGEAWVVAVRAASARVSRVWLSIPGVPSL